MAMAGWPYAKAESGEGKQKSPCHSISYGIGGRELGLRVRRSEAIID